MTNYKIYIVGLLATFTIWSCEEDDAKNASGFCQNVPVFVSLADDEMANGSFKEVCANSQAELDNLVAEATTEFRSMEAAAIQALIDSREQVVIDAKNKLDSIIDGTSTETPERQKEIVDEIDAMNINDDSLQSSLLDARAVLNGITSILKAGTVLLEEFENGEDSDIVELEARSNIPAQIEFVDGQNGSGNAIQVTIPANATGGEYAIQLKTDFLGVAGATYTFSYDWKATTDDHRFISAIFNHNQGFEQNFTKGFNRVNGGAATEWQTVTEEGFKWTQEEINLLKETGATQVIILVRPVEGKETTVLFDNMRFERTK